MSKYCLKIVCTHSKWANEQTLKLSVAARVEEELSFIFGLATTQPQLGQKQRWRRSFKVEIATSSFYVLTLINLFQDQHRQQVCTRTLVVRDFNVQAFKSKHSNTKSFFSLSSNSQTIKFKMKMSVNKVSCISCTKYFFFTKSVLFTKRTKLENAPKILHLKMSIT